MLRSEPLIEETLYLVSRPDLAPTGPAIDLASLAAFPLSTEFMRRAISSWARVAQPASTVINATRTINRTSLSYRQNVLPVCIL